MDASQWEPIADRLAAAFPDGGFDADRRARYLEALAPLPADGVARAVGQLLSEARAAPPSAAVIRQEVLHPRAPEAGAAWLDMAGSVRTRLPTLALLSTLVTVLALAAIAMWWLWSG